MLGVTQEVVARQRVADKRLCSERGLCLPHLCLNCKTVFRGDLPFNLQPSGDLCRWQDQDSQASRAPTPCST